jgi:hypothetical protein
LFSLTLELFGYIFGQRRRFTGLLFCRRFSFVRHFIWQKRQEMGSAHTGLDFFSLLKATIVGMIMITTIANVIPIPTGALMAEIRLSTSSIRA